MRVACAHVCSSSERPSAINTKSCGTGLVVGLPVPCSPYAARWVWPAVNERVVSQWNAQKANLTSIFLYKVVLALCFIANFVLGSIYVWCGSCPLRPLCPLQLQFDQKRTVLSWTSRTSSGPHLPFRPGPSRALPQVLGGGELVQGGGPPADLLTTTKPGWR